MQNFCLIDQRFVLFSWARVLQVLFVFCPKIFSGDDQLPFDNMSASNLGWVLIEWLGNLRWRLGRTVCISSSWVAHILHLGYLEGQQSHLLRYHLQVDHLLLPRLQQPHQLSQQPGPEELLQASLPTRLDFLLADFAICLYLQMFLI